MPTAKLSISPGNTPPAPLPLVPSSEIRQGDHPELPAPLPGILEGYVTIMAGAGGVGKTYLAEQILRHVASGVQLGRFPLEREGSGHAWALFLEDVAVLTQARSLDVAAFGTIPEDLAEPNSGHDTVWYCDDALRGTASLRERLDQAQEAAKAGGPPIPELIIIDYLHLFIGPQPSGVSPVDWERSKVVALRQVAIDYDLHILVLTHMTKEGKVNGTNALLNACDSMFVVEAKDDRNYASLTCRKMRVSPMTDYALTRRNNGTWGFDETGVFLSEALADGIMREVLAILRIEGPRTLSQLSMHHKISGTRNAIRQALTRGRRRGWVTTRAGHWHVLASPGDTALQPPATPDTPPAAPPSVPDPDRDAQGALIVLAEPAPCVRCGQGSIYTANGHPQHIGGFCQPPTTPEPAPVPAPRSAPASDDDGREEREADAVQQFPALAKLKESVYRSRYHAREWACVPKEHRDEPPWNLLHSSRSGGEPSARLWSRDVPLGGQLVLIDRNGSFPSACSSVPVAPAKLHHTGPMEVWDHKRAGIYVIDLPQWDDPTMPHPLGRIADTTAEQVAITTPHMKLLTALSVQGKIQAPTIRDSWTGLKNESLFEAFYKACKQARVDLLPLNDGTDNNPYTLHKRAISKAIRLLWPVAARSPFWRPDWFTSIVAEASVRHWLTARKAVQGGAFLVSLQDRDAALYWTEDGTLPAPYTLGDGFGEVKIKEGEQ